MFGRSAVRSILSSPVRSILITQCRALNAKQRRALSITQRRALNMIYTAPCARYRDIVQLIFDLCAHPQTFQLKLVGWAVLAGLAMRTQQERDDYLQALDATEEKPSPGCCWVYRTWCPLPEHQPVSENQAGKEKCGRREMKRRARSLQEAHSLIFTHLRESPYHDWQVDADEAWELAADCVDPGERAGRPYLDKQQVLAKQEVVIPEEPYEWQAPKRPRTQPATTSGGGGLGSSARTGSLLAASLALGQMLRQEDREWFFKADESPYVAAFVQVRRNIEELVKCDLF